MSDLDWNAITPLVVRARDAREEAAFSEIFRLLWLLAFNFVRKRYRDILSPEDAGEVVMEAFETTWRGLPKLREAAAFGGFFFTILVRKCQAARRVELARRVLVQSEESGFDSLVALTPDLAQELAAAAGEGAGYRHLVREELVAASRRRIMNVCKELTPTQRIVFKARVLNLFNETESVRRTGLPLGTVRSAYWTIVGLLRTEFQDAEFHGVPDAERKVAFLEALAAWKQQGAGGLA
jgi:DNA-directed RNA polymerase specialized sigma24 family protein